MAAITNAQVKNSVDGLIHRFDLFEQKEETRHEKIEADMVEIQHIVNGNAKEGIKTTVKTLKDDYDKRCEETKQSRSANLSLRNSLIVLGAAQVLTLIATIIGLIK